MLGCSAEDHNSARAQNTEQMQTFRCVKNIMINCASLTFRVEYEHVDAHQDDEKYFALLKQPAQMNCMCDRMAKGMVWGLARESCQNNVGFRLSLWPYMLERIKYPWTCPNM